MADPARLARLSDKERQLLAMLAEGHTAKTIAAAAGLSPNAINERLREARRKTGAGSLTLRVTFDRLIYPGSYSYVRTDPAAYPNCYGAPHLSADRRTFLYTCSAEAGRSYEIGFNSDRFRNFRSADGTPALASVLTFSAR